MKRQIVLGFSVVIIAGIYLTLGACNKHSLKGDEFNTGTKLLFQHHGEGEHGDGHGEGKGHDSDKGEHHEGRDAAKNDKNQDSKKGHKEASTQPAKSLFPRK